MNKLFALMAGLVLLGWDNALWADGSGTVQLKSIACADCHGAEGHNKELQGPNLAGQNSLYLIKQINSFLNDTRIHPILSPDGFKLDDDEAENLATYFANLKPENRVSKLSEDGELMYSPCSGCHGTKGEGVAPFPRLIGQKPAYLQQQLVNFKTGVRQSAVMQAIAINLSDEEIKLLAGYLGSSNKPDGIIASEIVSIDSNNKGR